MTLSRCYVGFSSTDKHYYSLMKAWKANGNHEFNFADCQLDKAINSEDEQYIKGLCRKCIQTSSTFIQLIGEDTRYKYKYVRWEAEVALEKGCRIICVNLNDDKKYNEATCPPILRDKGAIFVPFKQAIIQYAIENYKMNKNDNWHYNDETYKKLGL